MKTFHSAKILVSYMACGRQHFAGGHEAAHATTPLPKSRAWIDGWLDGEPAFMMQQHQGRGSPLRYFRAPSDLYTRTSRKCIARSVAAVQPRLGSGESAGVEGRLAPRLALYGRTK